MNRRLASTLLVLLFCFLIGPSLAQSQIAIMGTCSNTVNAPPGVPTGASCWGGAECEPVHRGGNSYYVPFIITHVFTTPFACRVLGAQHFVSVTGNDGADYLTATMYIFSYNSSMYVESRLNKHYCNGTKVPNTIVPFDIANCG